MWQSLRFECEIFFLCSIFDGREFELRSKYVAFSGHSVSARGLYGLSYTFEPIKPKKMTWKSIYLIHNPKNLSPHWNYQVFDIFSPFLLVLNHICQSRIKVACKVAKSFLTLFSVTLVKVEVQESNLHQMNHKKVYFLTCFMQNIQKPSMVGSRALNDQANHYGPPCKSLFFLQYIFSSFLK